MNILFLALDINFQKKTGDSIHVHELVSSLTKLGNEVVLIVANIDKKEQYIKWAENIPNLHLYFNKSTGGFKGIATIRYCRNIAKKHKVQIIYERRNSPKVSFILSRLLRIPGIIELNGLPSIEKDMFKEEGSKKTKEPALRKKISNYIFRSQSGIVAVTNGIKREIIKRTNVGDDKIFVIPNGANINLFKPIDKNLIKEKLGFYKNDKIICFVGNLAPWQGLEVLIKASPYVTKEEINAKFLIVGDGVMNKKLRAMVEEMNMMDRFFFPGAVAYENVPEYINACELCVAPFIRARNEIIGLSPLKIYEYLSCEKPVVASDIEGVGDFLKKTNSGIAVEPEDPKSLADGILKLLKDEELVKEMGSNGRRFVVQNHSWDGVALKVMEVCEDLM